MARLFLILTLILGQSPWPVLAAWSAPICHDPASDVCVPEPAPAPEPVPAGCCPTSIEAPTPIAPIGCPMTGEEVCTCGMAPTNDQPAPTAPIHPRAEHIAALVALADPPPTGELDWSGARNRLVAADPPRPSRSHSATQALFGVWRN